MNIPTFDVEDWNNSERMYSYMDNGVVVMLEDGGR